MKRKIFVAGLAVATLSACGTTSIYDRERPDEFAVTRAAPIQIPSEFNLPAPTPDAPRPQEGNIKDQVLDAIFGGAAPASPTTNP